jgi:hypothetical protein
MWPSYFYFDKKEQQVFKIIRRCDFSGGSMVVLYEDGDAAVKSLESINDCELLGTSYKNSLEESPEYTYAIDKLEKGE